MKTTRIAFPLIERNGPLIRFLAALILAAFLPATVIAAPLRYCIGQFVHVKDGFHANTQAALRTLLLEPTHSALHVLGPHCQDKPLLPIVAKPEKRYLWAPNHEPGLRPDPSPHPTASAHWRTKGQLQVAAPRLPHTDPRLRTRRTVVLLN